MPYADDYSAARFDAYMGAEPEVITDAKGAADDVMEAIVGFVAVIGTTLRGYKLMNHADLDAADFAHEVAERVTELFRLPEDDEPDVRHAFEEALTAERHRRCGKSGWEIRWAQRLAEAAAPKSEAA